MMKASGTAALSTPADLRAAFKNFLWNASLLEGRAIYTAVHLTRQPLLTPEERDFAGDVLRVEEHAHMRVMRQMARAFGPPPPRERMTILTGAHTELGWTLRALNITEADFVRNFPRIRRVYAALGEPWMVAAMERIRDEEAGHRIWGARVLQRLKHEHGLHTWRRGMLRQVRSRPISAAFRAIADALEP
jgi:hypothetical protein